MSQTEHAPRAAVVAAGAFVPAAECFGLWKLLHDDQTRRRRNGVEIRPEETRLAETLREAAMSAMSAPMSVTRSTTDIGPRLVCDTEALAVRLGCSPRHARRIARAEGIKPLSRNQWRREDLDHLSTRRP